MTQEEASAYASVSGLKYFEASAKDGSGVDEVFSALINECLKKQNGLPTEKT